MISVFFYQGSDSPPSVFAIGVVIAGALVVAAVIFHFTEQ